MESKVFGQSFLNESVLVMISLSPIVCVWYGLFVCNNAWLTLILFHLCLTSFPLLYIFFFTKTRTIDYFQGECQDFSEQLKHGGLLATVVIFLLSFITFFSMWYFKPIVEMIFGLSNKSCSDFAMFCDDLFEPVLFAIYFSIVNPIIEETYWRLFLLKVFPNDLFYKYLNSFLYSFYHWVSDIQFIIIKFSGYAQAYFVLALLTTVGYLQIFIKERLGWICGIGLHIGFDTSIMVYII